MKAIAVIRRPITSAAIVIERAGFRVVGGHGHIFDSPAKECLRRRFEEAVLCVDNGADGAIVGLQRPAIVCLSGCFEVGENVAAAKTVDRLLGVANHEKRIGLVLLMYAVEYVVLSLIRILKFINHNGRVLVGELRGQCIAGIQR